MPKSNKDKFKKEVILPSVIFFFPFVFIILHLTAIMAQMDCNLAEALLQLKPHILHSFFKIYPNDFKLAAALSGLYIVVPYFAYSTYLKKKDTDYGKEHGDSKFNDDLERFNKYYLYNPKFCNEGRKTEWDEEEAKNVLTTKKITKKEIKNCKKNAIVLSNDVYMSIDNKWANRNMNVLIIGGSGTGKSRFYVKPNLLQDNNCSYVVADPSGEMYRDLGPFFKERKYNIKVFNIKSLEHSCRYNPFKYCRSEADVPVMIDALIENTNKGKKGGDPFWELSEKNLFYCICHYIRDKYKDQPEKQNFSTVIEYLRKIKVLEEDPDAECEMDKIMKDLENENPNHVALKCWKTFRMSPAKTGMSMAVSAAIRVGTFFDLGAVANLTDEDDMELDTVGDKKTIIFVVTPDTSPYQFLASMLYTQLFDVLYKKAESNPDGRLKHHVRFMLDEFANIGIIPNFNEKLATMRKYEISCNIILQSLAQLKEMYEKKWEVLVGNCDTLVFLGSTELTTSEYLNKKLGKKTIRAIGNSYGKQGSMSTSATGQDLLSISQIGQMKNSYELIMIRGVEPFFATKFKYEKHPNYGLTGDADKKKKLKLFDDFNTPKSQHQENLLKEKQEELKRQELEKEKEIEQAKEQEEEIKSLMKPVDGELTRRQKQQLMATKASKIINQQPRDLEVVLEENSCKNIVMIDCNNSIQHEFEIPGDLPVKTMDLSSIDIKQKFL